MVCQHLYINSEGKNYRRAFREEFYALKLEFKFPFLFVLKSGKIFQNEYLLSRIHCLIWISAVSIICISE